MTPEQIEMVQNSWEKVKPISEQAADMFYAKLFEMDPDIKPLFKGDIKIQGRRLMAMLTTAVSNLHQLKTILEPVQDLGRRHVDYGVKPEHYDTVGAALLWTLGQGLGDGFTSEVEAAWAEAYTTLAGVMKEAAYG
ncbi:MAG: globin family protein [Gammaproteobacteria bacterium]|nr:globin family protein [Gammaproteobacteria bacterium]